MDKKQQLHCWINEHDELQIEQDTASSDVKVALCIPTDDNSLWIIIETLIKCRSVFEDVEEDFFPGHFIHLEPCETEAESS